MIVCGTTGRLADEVLNIAANTFNSFFFEDERLGRYQDFTRHVWLIVWKCLELSLITASHHVP